MICRTDPPEIWFFGGFLPDERKFRRGGSATDEVLSLFAAQTAEGLMQMFPKSLILRKILRPKALRDWQAERRRQSLALMV